MDVIIADDLWGDEGEGVIATWLFKSGEFVPEGAALAEVMYEKAGMEISAPASGRLTILIESEIPVRKGEVIARID